MTKILPFVNEKFENFVLGVYDSHDDKLAVIKFIDWVGFFRTDQKRVKVEKEL